MLQNSALTHNGPIIVNHLRSGLLSLFVLAWGTGAQDWQGYDWYQPTVERYFVVNAATSPLLYNHDSSIAWFRDRWFCLWNANTDPSESKPGQLNYLATSPDGKTWTEAVPAFSSPERNQPPIPCARGTQWQPNLIVVDDVLWAVWSQNSRDDYNGCYLSRLRSPEGTWENTRLLWDGSPEPLLDGVRWRVFPTQNPCRLRSGRILAPVTLSGPTAKDAPEGIGSWWGKEKRNSVIYTDDGGTTWQVSPGAIIPGKSWAQWEPTVWEAADGTVLMVARNNDFRAAGADGPRPAEMLTCSESHDGGATWTPHQFVPLETVASRMHVLPLDGDRTVMIHNDFPAGTFVQDRKNLALFFTRGKGVDFVAGPSISDWEPTVAYPQGWRRDDELLVSYSQGDQPRSIKVARIAPLPKPDVHYVLPRHREVPPVSPQHQPEGWRFDGGQSLHSAAPLVLGDVVTVSATFRSARGGCLVDTRTAGQRSGFVVGLTFDRGALKPFVFAFSPERNLIADLPLDRAGWNTLTVRIDRAQGQVRFAVNGKTADLPFQREEVPGFSGAATIGKPFAATSSVPGFVGELAMLRIDDGERNSLQIQAEGPLQGVVSPEEPAANHRAVLEEVGGKRLIRVVGDGSAGLELADNEGRRGDRIEIEGRVRVTGTADTDILTVGDANQWVWLGTRGGSFAVIQGAQTVPLSAAGGEWHTFSVVSGNGKTTVTLAGQTVPLPHDCAANWVYLGRAYGLPRAFGETWPEFQIDLGSLRSRVLPAR